MTATVQPSTKLNCSSDWMRRTLIRTQANRIIRAHVFSTQASSLVSSEPCRFITVLHSPERRIPVVFVCNQTMQVTVKQSVRERHRGIADALCTSFRRYSKAGRTDLPHLIARSSKNAPIETTYTSNSIRLPTGFTLVMSKSTTGRNGASPRR